MAKIPFYRKQPEASNDYELAYNIINDLKAGKNIEVTPDNIVSFRKYAYDLAAKQNKEIRTSKNTDSLIVYCLK